MNMWPKTREGWIKATHSVLAFCLLLFTFSVIILAFLPAGWIRNDYVSKRMYGTFAGYIARVKKFL